MGNLALGDFIDSTTFFKQPEEQLKNCLPQIEAIPVTCTPENVMKTKGQFEKCMTEYVGPAARCLELTALPAGRKNWVPDLPKYFAPYYKLMPVIYKRFSGLMVSPPAAKKFTDAIHSIYLASIAQGKPEIIIGIATVLGNLAQRGNLTDVINYVQNTKFSDLAPDFPPVEAANMPAITLYVWTGKFAWPEKREGQLFNEALQLFPPKPIVTRWEDSKHISPLPLLPPTQ